MLHILLNADLSLNLSVLNTVFEIGLQMHPLQIDFWTWNILVEKSAHSKTIHNVSLDGETDRIVTFLDGIIFDTCSKTYHVHPI